MKIGVISDTHGLLRPEAVACLSDSDCIIHAGDIGKPGIIEALEEIAPVTAIRGNVDRGVWARPWPEEQTVEPAGQKIHILHDLKTLRFDPAERGIDIVISGHSHKPGIKRTGGVLYLNPGSAGRRRFRLPITVATIILTGSSAKAGIHTIL